MTHNTGGYVRGLTGELKLGTVLLPTEMTWVFGRAGEGIVSLSDRVGSIGI